jgi:sialate O-acetylesterase
MPHGAVFPLTHSSRWKRLTASSAVLPALADRAQFEKALADYPAIYAAEKREDDAAKAAGKPAPKHDWHPNGSSWLPSGPYNAMIAPLTNYSLKGLLWYQGESDTSAARGALLRSLLRSYLRLVPPIRPGGLAVPIRSDLKFQRW